MQLNARFFYSISVSNTPNPIYFNFKKDRISHLLAQLSQSLNFVSLVHSQLFK